MLRVWIEFTNLYRRAEVTKKCFRLVHLINFAFIKCIAREDTLKQAANTCTSRRASQRVAANLGRLWFLYGEFRVSTKFGA